MLPFFTFPSPTKTIKWMSLLLRAYTEPLSLDCLIASNPRDNTYTYALLGLTFLKGLRLCHCGKHYPCTTSSSATVPKRNRDNRNIGTEERANGGVGWYVIMLATPSSHSKTQKANSHSSLLYICCISEDM